ncbi:murein transglycosylase domain-containing protein [Thiomicrorhabdus sp. 6S3-12]|uniref:murein transglycosylase domain-containing protein n=1 Tax=Thiomicrorhabdus sp. 6S3-12 TaxID=2819681 RepID=UPI001AAD5DAC|nr:murein transglycosylase domain-containing protein [Thiomicrorhabdus sp. 6S3-12]MBO1924506.1 DUF3393 domain-containing protein [Thiomicrorhabdus sp. 6S3-12]
MNSAKASNFWLLSVGGFLLLTASYASSMHSWLQQQTVSSGFSSSPIAGAFSADSVANSVSSQKADIVTPNVLPQERYRSNSSSPSLNDETFSQSDEVDELSTQSAVALSEKTGFSQALWPWLSLSLMQNASGLTVEKPASTHSAIASASAKSSSSTVDTAQTASQVHSEIVKEDRIEAVEYDDEIIIEFPEALATTTRMKKAISHLLLSGNPAGESDLQNIQKFDLSVKPYYYNRILDKSQHSIRYPAQAYEFAKILLAEHAYWVNDQGQKYLHVQIPLSDTPMAKITEEFNSRDEMARLDRYRNWAQYYALRYKVPYDLVMAIMRVESAFNPKARSRSNAIGLMQIKAGSAGRDVYELIDGKMQLPTESELFDEQNNIRIGTAYLGLLHDLYFKEVKDPKNRELLVISAYNAGLNTVLKLFANNPQRAMEEINHLSPQQLYQTLRYQHTSEEARQYLDKVLSARQKNNQV